MNWPKPPPPPPSSTSSWGTSSIVSDATPDNLASESEELTVQQVKMTEATTKLLAVVSEVGGGPWEVSPGLTEGALTVWMGEQEDRNDELKERLERKQGELARLAKVAEADLVSDQALPHLETAFRFIQGQDISQIERLQRLPNSGRAEGPVNGQVRTLTPADGEDRVSQVGVKSFLWFSGREEEELEERRRLREQASRDRDR